MELNRLASDFELPGLNGRIHRLSDYRGRIVVVNFWSCDCPHVVRADARMLASSARWGAEVVLLTIASNANESAGALENASRSRGLPTVMKDAGHVIADLYAAQVTPEVFVVDRAGILRYRGAVDDVSFRWRGPTRSYLDEAVDALLDGRLPTVAEVPAFGCSIIRET
jgi:thiol-disulfide isomerase/thioredoxin